MDVHVDAWFTQRVHCFLENFQTGEKMGLLELERDVFGQAFRQDILSRVLYYEQSWREQGTESTKALGQVRGSTRKAFPGKGRGKARVGTIRAPQFKGGYTVHGPRPHDKSIDIQRKVYDLGIKVALSAKFAMDQMRIVDKIEFKGDSKKDFQEQLEVLGLLGKKTYFLHGSTFPDEGLLDVLNKFEKKLAVQGQGKEHPLMMTRANHVSAKALLDHEFIVLDKEAVELLEEIYLNPV